MQTYRLRRGFHAFSKDCATKKLLTAEQDDTTLRFLVYERERERERRYGKYLVMGKICGARYGLRLLCVLARHSFKETSTLDHGSSWHVQISA